MLKTEVIRIRKKVLESLNPFYTKNDYILIDQKASFVKGELKVLWGVSSKYIDSLTFRPQFRVENKKIKSILQEIFPNQIGFFTIVRSQSIELIKEMETNKFTSNYIVNHEGGGTSYYYSIEKDTDLNLIVEDHVNFMNDIGFPFIEKLNTLEGVDEYINCRVLNGDYAYFLSYDRQIQLMNFFDRREVLSGVISAFLTKNSKLEELLSRYKIMFKGNNYILDDFNKIVEYFENDHEA